MVHRTSIKQQLEILARQAFKELFDINAGVVSKTDRPDIADFQCNCALSHSGKLGDTPRVIADKVAKKLKGNELASVDVTGPGFINFTVTNTALMNQFSALYNSKRFLCEFDECPKTIIFDYGGPNIAKTMHVGHLRSAVIGDALKNIFAFKGHNVISDIHLGDWGLQMGLVIAELESKADLEGTCSKSLELSEEDLIRIYPEAAIRAKSDLKFKKRAQLITFLLQGGDRKITDLWQLISNISLTSIRKDYDQLGICFDQWFGESRYQEALPSLVEELENNQIAEVSDGALIVPITNNGSELAPLILRNSRGGFGYAATDLACLRERLVSFAADEVYYIVDNRQKLHFQQVFYTVGKMAFPTENKKFEHVSFGTVNGLDGKPFKTREGNIMQLRELVVLAKESTRRRIVKNVAMPQQEVETASHDIAVGALKFGDLFHDRQNNYVFDLEKFLDFEGNTGPYLQYTCARISAVLERAKEEKLPETLIRDMTFEVRNVIIELDRFSEVIETSCNLKKPNILASHLISLSNKFNKIYAKHKIFGNRSVSNQSSELISIYAVVYRQVKLGLSLLGINVPKRM